MTREQPFAEAIGFICLGLVVAIVGVIVYECVAGLVWLVA